MTLPLIRMAPPGANPSTLLDDLTPDDIDQRLIEHGAVLLRGYGVFEDAAFEPVCRALCPELKLYIEGNSPRDHTSDFVYTSTNYPAEYDISMHNELSYAHSPPQRLFFYCSVAPESGGETPLVDCRSVLNLMRPEVLKRFEERGVRYVQSLHGGHGLGRSWQEVFETQERDVVDEYLAGAEAQAQWSEFGTLRIEQVRPALRTHPKSGERVWFNQADQWHPTNLDEPTRKALQQLLDESDFPLYATYGDGSPIAPEDLAHVRDVMWNAATRTPWQAGDVLVIDNFLVAHGRRAFVGNRRVSVAMG